MATRLEMLYASVVLTDLAGEFESWARECSRPDTATVESNCYNAAARLLRNEIDNLQKLDKA